MKLFHVGPVALFLPLIFCSSLSAQTAQPVSVQVSGLFHRSYDESLRWAWGGEGQVRWTRGAWSLGAGVQYTVSNLNDTDFPGGPSDYQVSTLGLFMEPRFVFQTFWNRLGFYVHGRIGVTGISENDSGAITVTDTFGNPIGLEPYSIEGTAIASEANAGLGVLTRLTPRVNLDLGGTVGYARWGGRTRDRPAWYEFVGGWVGLVIGL